MVSTGRGSARHGGGQGAAARRHREQQQQLSARHLCACTARRLLECRRQRKALVPSARCGGGERRAGGGGYRRATQAQGPPSTRHRIGCLACVPPQPSAGRQTDQIEGRVDPGPLTRGLSGPPLRGGRPPSRGATPPPEVSQLFVTTTRKRKRPTGHLPCLWTHFCFRGLWEDEARCLLVRGRPSFRRATRYGTCTYRYYCKDLGEIKVTFRFWMYVLDSSQGKCQVK